MSPNEERPLLVIARAYIAAGLSVIPVKHDGSKRPAVPWEPYTKRRPADEDLIRWFGPH